MRSNKIILLSLAAALCLLTSSAFASGGGTCPTGANYIDLSNPTNGGGNGSITLATMGVTNCFYVSSIGLDTNTGASEGSSWLHAPGMPNCTNNCASATINGGTGVILRGGDTWHKSSGSPGMGGGWSWSKSGTSLSVPVYVGVDFTWFSGASFARPIINSDNAISTSLVATCSFNDDGTTFISLGSTTNVIWDMIEETGDCAAGSGSGTLLSGGSANVIERNYTHGWTFASAASGDTRYRWSGGAGANRWLFNVMDGADSTYGATCTTPSCVQNSGNYVTNGAAGGCITEAFDFEYNVVRHCSNVEPSDVCIVHDNLEEYLFEPSIGTQHGNIFETFAPGNFCVNFFFYNNLVRHVNEGVGLWPQVGLGTSPGGAVVYFNNVYENDGHFPPDINGFMGSPACNPGCNISATMSFYLFNNTLDSTVAGRAGPSNTTTPSWGSSSVATLQNNYVVGTSPMSSVWSICNGSGSGCAGNAGTTTDNGNEVLASTSQATAQNYLLSNDFSPGNGGGTYASVHAGANLSSTLCSTIAGLTGAPSGILTACESGTSKGVTEISQWGGFAASYPAITVNSRGTTWDAGAYQFTSSSQAIAPSCTPGTGTYSGPQSVTCTNSNSGTTVMCFTTDGSTPSTNGGGTGCGHGTVYSAAITITQDTTLKIIAGTSTLTDSSVVTYTYAIQASAPTCAPVAGTYINLVIVSLSTSTGSVICYNTTGSPATNGTTGCAGGSILFSSPITITASSTIFAVSGGTNFVDSPVTSCGYTITSPPAPAYWILADKK